MTDPRSRCPINLTLEVLGDKWSLLVIRDMIFAGRRHFRELLTQSDEGIASNILADRLKTLVDQGLITKSDDPTHKQKAIYSLSEKGIALVPVLAKMADWGSKHLPVTEDFRMRGRLLAEAGEAGWKSLMSELRETHLGTPSKRRRKSLFDQFQSASYATRSRAVRQSADVLINGRPQNLRPAAVSAHEQPKDSSLPAKRKG